MSRNPILTKVIPRHRPYEIHDVVVVDELDLKRQEMELLLEREELDRKERDDAEREEWEYVQRLREAGL